MRQGRWRRGKRCGCFPDGLRQRFGGGRHQFRHGLAHAGQAARQSTRWGTGGTRRRNDMTTGSRRYELGLRGAAGGRHGRHGFGGHRRRGKARLEARFRTACVSPCVTCGRRTGQRCNARTQVCLKRLRAARRRVRFYGRVMLALCRFNRRKQRPARLGVLGFAGSADFVVLIWPSAELLQQVGDIVGVFHGPIFKTCAPKGAFPGQRPRRYSTHPAISGSLCCLTVNAAPEPCSWNQRW